jgi:hypothetical protein
MKPMILQESGAAPLPYDNERWPATYSLWRKQQIDRYLHVMVNLSLLFSQYKLGCMLVHITSQFLLSIPLGSGREWFINCFRALAITFIFFYTSLAAVGYFVSRIRYSCILSLFDRLFRVYRILSWITRYLNIVGPCISPKVQLEEFPSIHKLLELQPISCVLWDLQWLLTGPVPRKPGYHLWLEIWSHTLKKSSYRHVLYKGLFLPCLHSTLFLLLKLCTQWPRTSESCIRNHMCCPVWDWIQVSVMLAIRSSWSWRHYDTNMCKKHRTFVV